MTDITLINGLKNTSANTRDVQYLSPANGSGTIIKAFSAYNDTVSSRTFKVYIGTDSAIIPLKILVKNKTYTGPELIGQLIPAGATLSMESDLAESIEFRVTGEEV